MTQPRSRAPRRWLLAALALAVVAAVALGLALTGQQSPPQPAGAAGTPTSAPAPPAPPAPGVPSSPAGVPAAATPAPVSVAVPTIDVTSELLRLGLNGDGTVEVSPLGPDDQAGWYEPGPAPGAVGPAVILGHVDSAEHGPGVFYDLGALSPGDPIEVTRADGTVAVFVVDRVERHPKDDFPTIAVYGNTPDPQLRLITCGGAFDSAAGSYEDNVIAFATLQETRPV
ncbi:class F sortase [Trujillonella humicola]|uniref:class F sortase n=1 Tax=Trujillonella humicola TaxID=3383699 RepID=UPI0039058C43